MRVIEAVLCAVPSPVSLRSPTSPAKSGRGEKRRGA
jgi:hypothetical protein